MSPSDLDFSNLIVTKTLLWWNDEHTILCDAGGHKLLGVHAYNDEYWYVELTQEEHDLISEKWPDVSIVDFYQHSRQIYSVSRDGVIVKPPWVYKEFWIE